MDKKYTYPLPMIPTSPDIPIRVNPILPIKETVPASNIETRKEVKLLTGNMIDAFKMDGVLYVSEEYYELIKSL